MRLTQVAQQQHGEAAAATEPQATSNIHMFLNIAYVGKLIVVKMYAHFNFCCAKYSHNTKNFLKLYTMKSIAYM